MTDEPWELFKGRKPKARDCKVYPYSKQPLESPRKPPQRPKPKGSYRGTPWEQLVSDAKLGRLVMRSNPSYRATGSEPRGKGDNRIASRPAPKQIGGYKRRNEE